MSDVILWEQFKSGDQEAFQQIYGDHVSSLIRYGLRFTPDKTLIEDAIHDLFVYIWQNRQSLSTTDSIRRYLLVALRRNIIKKLQKQNKISDSEPEEVSFEASLSIEDNLIASEWASERKQQLKVAFKELSSRQKEAIFLKYQHNMNYEEICEAMDISYQSARNLVSTGIKKLRKIVGAAVFLIFLLLL